MLTAIAGALYSNKFESSETSTTTRTVNVNCSVYSQSFFLLLNSWSPAGQTMMTKAEKSSDLGKLSAVMVRLIVR